MSVLTSQSVIEFKKRCDEEGIIASHLQSLKAHVNFPVLDVGSGTGQISVRAWGNCKNRQVIHLDNRKYTAVLPDNHTRVREDFLEYDPKLDFKIGTILFSHFLQYVSDKLDVVNKQIEKLEPETVIVVRNKNDYAMKGILAWAKKQVGFTPEDHVSNVPPPSYQLLEKRALTARVTCDNFEDLTEQVFFLLNPAKEANKQQTQGELEELLKKMLGERSVLDINQEILVYGRSLKCITPEITRPVVASVVEPDRTDNSEENKKRLEFAIKHGSYICGIVEDVMRKQLPAIVETLLLWGQQGVVSATWFGGSTQRVDDKRYNEKYIRIIQDNFSEDEFLIPSLTQLDNTYFDTQWHDVQEYNVDNLETPDQAAGGASGAKKHWECFPVVNEKSFVGVPYTMAGEGYNWDSDPKDKSIWKKEGIKIWKKEEYEKAFRNYAKDIAKSYFQNSPMVTTLMVPIALKAESSSRHQKLGCVVLHLGTPSYPLTQVQLEQLYSRIQLYWHDRITGTILADRTKERDSAIDAQRLFNLAEGPLERLTHSFEEAQDAAQMLREIVYPPFGALSASGSTVAKYFSEGNVVHIAGESIPILHKPEDYYLENEYGSRHAAAVLLAVIGAVFGIHIPEYRQIALLLADVRRKLYIKTRENEGIRQICQAIVGDDKDGEIWKRVVDVIVFGAKGKSEADDKVKYALDLFKDAVHEPYKYGTEGCSLVPLACSLLVRDSANLEFADRQGVFDFHELTDFLYNEDRRELKMWQDCSLPVPRSVFVWAAVDWAVTDGTTVKVDQKQGSITLSKGRGPSSHCLKAMKKVIETAHLTAEGGDETREWYRFASACVGVKEASIPQSRTLEIEYEGGRTVIHGMDDGFEIRVCK